ncbi:MAG: hypothetical protein R2875_17725 [Desulfobacterales bacterium]
MGVVFLDAVALNNDAFAVDLDSLRYTTGLGLRYNTVIGPLPAGSGISSIRQNRWQPMIHID